MANSRNSRKSSEAGAVIGAIERALGDLLARVFLGASGTDVEVLPGQGSDPSLAAVADRAPALPLPAHAPAFGLALSGGLDSVVLLHVAARVAATCGMRLFVFHVHHGLSKNADHWEQLCREQASALAAGFDVRHVRVDAHDARGVEEAARVARYDALGQMCRTHGVPLLLAAHHRDDQAETVLLQLMRGAGVAGLSGMASLQAHALLGPGVLLGRPLLGLPRSALEQVASATNLAFVTDESNEDRRYRRNALRHDIMPVMDQHFPGFAEMVTRSARHAQGSQVLQHELARIDLNSCLPADGRTDDSVLSVAGLAALSPVRADNLLRDWLHGHGVAVPSTARLAEIRAQMLGAPDDSQPYFDFASQTLHRYAGCLELHPRLGAPPEGAVRLNWQGEPWLDIPAWHGRLVFETADGQGLCADALRAGPLLLLPREGQERLKPASNRPSKSLKSLFQEAGVPSWKRKWSPVLYIGEQLVFVAGLGMDARCLVQGQAYRLRWENLPAKGLPHLA